MDLALKAFLNPTIYFSLSILTKIWPSQLPWKKDVKMTSLIFCYLNMK